MREEDGTDASQESAPERETSNIRAYLDRDGVWFCLVDTDDVRVHDHLEQIEMRLSRADEDDRIPGILVPEPEREEAAPVVGTVEHIDGEVIDITIDLSDWDRSE